MNIYKSVYYSQCQHNIIVSNHCNSNMDYVNAKCLFTLSVVLLCITTGNCQPLCTEETDKLSNNNIAAIGCAGNELSIACPPDYLVLYFRHLVGCSGTHQTPCIAVYNNATDHIEEDHVGITGQKNGCIWKENRCNITTQLSRDSYSCKCHEMNYKNNYVMMTNMTCIKREKVNEMCKHSETSVTEGFVISPGYPLSINQAIGKQCTLVLQFNTTMALQLQSQVIDLATNGKSDLYITNLDTSTRYGPFRGENLFNLTLVTSAVKFSFSTNTTTTHKGFLITYSATPSDDVIKLPSTIEAEVPQTSPVAPVAVTDKSNHVSLYLLCLSMCVMLCTIT